MWILEQERARPRKRAIEDQRLAALFEKSGLPGSVRDEWFKHRYRVALLREQLGYSLALIGSSILDKLQ